MQHMQIFLKVSSWVTLRPFSDTDTKSYKIKFSHETSLKATFCSLALIWGSLSVLWRLLLQLAECEPCLCPWLKDEKFVERWNPWSWNWLRDFMWDLLNKSIGQLHNYHFLRCSKVSIVNLPWSPWFSMSQVSFLSWRTLSQTLMIGKNGLREFFSDSYRPAKLPENDVLLDPFHTTLFNIIYLFIWHFVRLESMFTMSYPSNRSLPFCWRWLATFFRLLLR